MYFDKTGIIQRLTETSGDSNKEDYQSVTGLAGFPINVQPSSPETTVLVNGVYGKTYTVYTTHSGIKDGDRLTVSGLFTDGKTQNKTLQVSNVGNWSFPPLPHFEITCVEIET
jgi:hypothetical protein